MVKFLLIMMMPLLLFAQEVKVEVLLDQTSLSVSEPVSGTINITHPSKDQVDTASFTYQGKALAVDFLRKAHFEGPESLDVESFRFKLPPFPEGLHLIEPVSVKVAGAEFKSAPVSLEVKKIARVTGEKPYLKLEKIFRAPEPLYPGQKATVGYRYLYQGGIDLREEVIPLIDQNPFISLGEKEVRDFTEGGISIREVIAQVRAEKPGEFAIPKSFISGYAYQEKRGVKTYVEPKLTSEVPPFKILVSPFPEHQKPPFFYGAIGPFEMTVHIKAPPRLEVGDKFVLYVTYKGKGELSTLKPLVLSCLPGWEGFFQASDLPPEEAKKEGEVTFTYELKPLTSLIQQLPSLYTAYFDPEKATYPILKSDPIPLNVAEVRPNQPPTPPPEIVMHAILNGPNEVQVNRKLEGLLQQEISGGQSGDFYEALGHEFADLAKIPEAIWSYQKALSFKPWSQEVRKNLKRLQEKLFLPPDLSFTLPLSFLFQFFILSFVLFILLWRWFIFRLALGALSLFLLLFMGYSLWIAPLNGVILRSTYLYQTPSPSSPLVREDPLPSGLKIEVYGVEKEGKWLKVKDSESNIGFISYDSIRIF